METIVHARELCKRYGTFSAVDGIDFDVRKGECYGMLGPNGAGKTTAIRMIYGFSPITSGTMLVFGLDIERDWREIRSRIGVCQQENTLDPDLSVERNLLVFAGYFSMARDRARRRTDELLSFFALERKRKDRVNELSGGLARRLILARSLINNPALIILDEPTTGLDPQSRHLLWERLERLRDQGATLLLTTHYMEEAARLCDRLMIMDHGKILVQGEPDQLIEDHVGRSVIEIEGGEAALREYLRQNNIRHDDLDDRLIIYHTRDTELEERIRTGFCTRKCIFREATLEDVFLSLTGRELRE
ncbi:MAG: ABC transporter ATP-binding protein [Desulfovibrionales bacterium]